MLPDNGSNSIFNLAFAEGMLSIDQDMLTIDQGILSIDQANANVAANSDTGTSNGIEKTMTELTPTALVNNESATLLTEGSANGSATNADNYSLLDTGLGRNNNLTLTNGSLNSDQANANVTANSSNGIWNVTELTPTGRVNNESAYLLTGVSPTGNSTDADNYSLLDNGLDRNYNLTFTNRSLTIYQAYANLTSNSSNGIYTGLLQSLTGFTATGRDQQQKPQITDRRFDKRKRR